MEKWEIVKQKQRTRITQSELAIRENLRHRLRYPGRELDLKTKDFIGPDETQLFISQS